MRQRIARDVEELEALRLRAKLTACSYCGQIVANDRKPLAKETQS